MTFRPHHGMCLHFYQGKGYSDEFTCNMDVIVKRLEDEPDADIVLTVGADAVCGSCPNNDGGVCVSIDKVESYDRAVLEICGLSEGGRIPYSRFAELVRQRIIDAGLRADICGDCVWNDICEDNRPEGK